MEGDRAAIYSTAASLAALPLGFPERWILDRLQGAIADCAAALEDFHYNDYANTAYRFFRDDLCDWYLEWAKHQFKAGGAAAATAEAVLAYGLDASLRLLHPGMPFITEHLWQQLQTCLGGAAWKDGQYLMLARWPEPVAALRTEGADRRMAELQAVVAAVRNVRNLVGLADSVQGGAVVAAPDDAQAKALDADRDFLIDRANLASLKIAANVAKPQSSITTVVGAFKVHFPFAGLVDLGKLKDQLGKRAATLEKAIAGKQGRLGNADYVARAPAAQVEETSALLAQEMAELANLRETLAGL